jgi:hypothetical protein
MKGLWHSQGNLKYSEFMFSLNPPIMTVFSGLKRDLYDSIFVILFYCNSSLNRILISVM